MFNILLFTLTISLSMSSYALTKGYITDEHPNSRYTVHDNGTVTDNITGLMWKRCSQGQTLGNNTCTNSANTHTWSGALQQAESEDFADHNDWRLPNIKELRSIAAYNRYTPSINDDIFPNTPANYFWSSSPNANNKSTAWRFNFDDGDDNSSANRTSPFHVRLVRLGH